METLKTLRDQVLHWLDEAGDTGTTATNVNNAINQAHQRRLSTTAWPFMLWDTPETFTTTSGTQLYALHQEFSRPYYFYDRTAQVYLVEMPSRGLAPSGLRWNTDTGGQHFALWGRSAVQYQPSASSVITVVSTSASDTTSGKAVIVRGVSANGVTTESFTPVGTTPVVGTTAFTKILNVTKGAAWIGTLSMTSNAAAVTNLKLLPGEFGRSYQQLFLLSNPPTSNTIEYRFYRLPSPLTNDNDMPDIPPPHAQVLVWDALILLSAYNNQIDRGRIAVWGEQANRIEESMRQSYLEGQSLESQARYIRDVDHVDVPRFFQPS